MAGSLRALKSSNPDKFRLADAVVNDGAPENCWCQELSAARSNLAMFHHSAKRVSGGSLVDVGII
jgi:hypothetical protein